MAGGLELGGMGERVMKVEVEVTEYANPDGDVMWIVKVQRPGGNWRSSESDSMGSAFQASLLAVLHAEFSKSVDK